MQLPEDADQATVERRFRRLLHCMDPHAANSPRAAAACQELRKAYASLLVHFRQHGHEGLVAGVPPRTQGPGPGPGLGLGPAAGGPGDGGNHALPSGSAADGGATHGDHRHEGNSKANGKVNGKHKSDRPHSPLKHAGEARGGVPFK